jgi:hypothetical protein
VAEFAETRWGKTFLGWQRVLNAATLQAT